MKVIMDLGIVPLGIGTSVSDPIVEVHKILKKYKLKTNLHAYGTNIEGEWEDVMAALKECHEKVHEMGAPRIHTNIKLGTRTDRDQTMEEKIESVSKKLSE